ncbi:MAG: hypothetical protein HQ503_01570, partial [Rhodospirillales bacterium]|nr:hypothetical protein [Rhodospirillales bacterium]
MSKDIVKYGKILGIALFLGFAAFSADAQSLPSTEAMMAERAIGNANAPIT